MGVSHSPQELSGKLARLARDFSGDYPRTVVEDASLTTKKIITGIAPARLRGAGKRGARLSVAYNVTGTGTDAAALVFARGPWQLIESDTSPHQIPRTRGGRARRRYAVFGGHVYSRVAHPGTRGQHPWRRGVELARPIVGVAFRNKATTTLRRIF